MIFLRRQFPLVIMLVTGLLFAGLYDIPHSASGQPLMSAYRAQVALDLFKERA
ncbi:MAG: hypothetical protein OJF51_004548 [Nitrospira sp.]|jgi:hypothetical protein|nr:MAG: hypothetical protein OJF51_004548 [Nitrospira sp.]